MRAMFLQMGAAVLAGAAVGLGLWTYLGGAPAEPVRASVVSVGDVRLTVPPSYLHAGSNDDRAELVARFPDFRPAARTDDVTAKTNLDDRFQRLVFLDLKPADGPIDPSDRMARLYERFLSETSWTHPGGLVARAFEPDSPFAGDELFYAPPEGRAFAARCRKPDQAARTPVTCTTSFRTGTMDVDVRFSASLLSDWERLDAGAKGLVETLRR